MPANLPQEAKAKWNEVTITKNPETRLALMDEFLSLVPKHKGTEKLRMHVKRQMAQLRDEIEKKKKQAKKTGGPSYYVQKAGAAQVAVIGPPNVGRSSLLKATTNSSVEVTSWPWVQRRLLRECCHTRIYSFSLWRYRLLWRVAVKGKLKDL